MSRYLSGGRGSRQRPENVLKSKGGVGKEGSHREWFGVLEIRTDDENRGDVHEMSTPHNQYRRLSGEVVKVPGKGDGKHDRFGPKEGWGGK